MAWRGALALPQVAAEAAELGTTWSTARELSAEGRIMGTLVRWDREAGLPDGYVHGIVRAINEHVPPHGTVQLVAVPDRKRIRALVPLPHLTFPRRMRADYFPLPAGWEPDADSVLLVFGDALLERLRAKKTLLASGPDWTLWR